MVLIERVLQQVRTLSLDLRPSLLDDLGIGPALRWLAKRQAERAGFNVVLDIDDLHGRYAPDLETICFRVAQEALTNITRHAHASEVVITIGQRGTLLAMLINDDGIGFDVAAARRQAVQGHSMGLLSMQERVELAGGVLEITSAPGSGTSLYISLPLLESVPERLIERRRKAR
jgi:signal transduction histidine kinase